MGFWDGIFGGPKPKPKRHRKNGVAVGNHWKTLEEKGKRSNHFKGYKITTQKYSSSTHTRPDFVGYSKKNPRDRIVGDAKNVNELKYQHVDQVRKYKDILTMLKKEYWLLPRKQKFQKKYENMHEILISQLLG